MHPAGQPAARLITRLRADGVFSLQVLKTALATALAFELGRVTASPYPVFAALAALLVVQVTVFDSVSRGLQRVGGVIVGVLVSYAIARQFGLHAWSLGLVVLVGLATGRALRLGDSGAIQVPVSALLVLTVGTSGRYVEDRILETVIGAAVGIAVNAVLVPPTRTREAGQAVARLADALGDLLAAAGTGLHLDDWQLGAPGWLASARALQTPLITATAAVDRGERSLRLNPRGARLAKAAQRRRLALSALARINTQVRGIARTLADAALHPDPGQPERAPARRSFGAALEAVAATLHAYAAVALEPDVDAQSGEAETLRANISVARDAIAVSVRAAQHVPTWSDSGWLIYGSLLTDLNRVLDEVDGDPQAELLAAGLLPRRISLRRYPQNAAGR